MVQIVEPFEESEVAPHWSAVTAMEGAGLVPTREMVAD